MIRIIAFMSTYFWISLAWSQAWDGKNYQSCHYNKNSYLGYGLTSQIFEDSMANSNWLSSEAMLLPGICSDGTLSYWQPMNGVDSNEYEGRCGQTAIANIATMLCQKHLPPEYFIENYSSDWLPGLMPQTVLNQLKSTWKRFKCKGQAWTKQIKNSKAAFHKTILESIRKRFPVAALINNSKTNLFSPHWVTIVDAIDYGPHYCVYTINYEHLQRVVTCEEFAQQSKMVDGLYPILRGYTLVVLE